MDHLFVVSELSKKIGNIVELKSICELLGLLHDFGKYRHEFQLYIMGEYRGTVNHTSAGARILEYIEVEIRRVHFDEVNQKQKIWNLYKEILQYPILSHHGLYDIIDKDYNYRTKIRLDYNSNSEEVKRDLEFFNFLNAEYLGKNNKSIYDLYCEGFTEFEKIYLKLKDMARKFTEKIDMKKALYFYYGALIRLLLSILKEADIYDSSNYYRTNKDIVYSMDDLSTIWNQMGNLMDDLYAMFEKKTKQN